MISKSTEGFRELVESNSNQPILISSSANIATKLLLEEVCGSHSVVEFNDFDSTESIKIDQIRDLTSLNASSEKQNLIVIYNFDLAGTEAQNAFLKTLEETVGGISFVLTTKNAQRILKTVTSRCLSFSLGLGDDDEVSNYITTNLNPLKLKKSEISTILRSNRGNVDACVSNIKNEDSLEIYRQAIADAKQLIAKQAEPIEMLGVYYKDRSRCIMLLSIALSIAEHKLQSDIDGVRTWAKMAKMLVLSKEHIERNVNSKLVLDKLVLELL